MNHYATVNKLLDGKDITFIPGQIRLPQASSKHNSHIRLLRYGLQDTRTEHPEEAIQICDTLAHDLNPHEKIQLCVFRKTNVGNLCFSDNLLQKLDSLWLEYCCFATADASWRRVQDVELSLASFTRVCSGWYKFDTLKSKKFNQIAQVKDVPIYRIGFSRKDAPGSTFSTSTWFITSNGCINYYDLVCNYKKCFDESRQQQHVPPQQIPGAIAVSPSCGKKRKMVISKQEASPVPPTKKQKSFSEFVDTLPVQCESLKSETEYSCQTMVTIEKVSNQDSTFDFEFYDNFFDVKQQAVVSEASQRPLTPFLDDEDILSLCSQTSNDTTDFGEQLLPEHFFFRSEPMDMLAEFIGEHIQP